ncbi:MAG: D-alanyl-D-alanine carboxypeptidase/D-alanyl-D-alanine-endopeptidase [Dysgonomonas sp.]|nr:D-alanyl-D-alanine carboxypeptidase/D-alanyl-D-alanine-endopeptidase [Dysgonomonas sp.]
MRLKIQYLLIILILAPYILSAQMRQEGIQQFLSHKSLKHASIGICVKDLSGKQMAAHNADKMYTPASILKVVTTATALELLGPDFQYETVLSKDKDNENHLLVHGYGDPTLGTKHLDNISSAFLSQWGDIVKQNFDTTQSVDITVVDDYFGYDGISQRWIYQDMGNYYAAGAYGISIFDNTYQLYFDTSRRDTCPVITGTDPEVNLSFTNTLKLNSTGRDNGYIHGLPHSTNRLLTGDIPAGKTSFSIKGDIPDPGLCLGEVLAKQLNGKGFTIDKIGTTYKMYYEQMYLKERRKFDEIEIYRHKSFPLKDIIKETNVRSNNHYAEHLIRTIGRTKDRDIYTSPLTSGIDKTNEFWKGKMLNTDALTMFDGSGLAPSNAVSPAFMCDLLIYMQAKSKNSEAFLKSLPQAGKEGTVRNRLKGTKLAGKIYMKSGSIYGVQCFAGYYINGDKKYAFTVMVNKFTGSRSQITLAIDKLLLSLF